MKTYTEVWKYEIKWGDNEEEEKRRQQVLTNLKCWKVWAKYWPIWNVDKFELNIDQFEILTNLS